MIIQKIEVSGVEEIEQRLGAFKSKAPLVVSRAINRAVSNIRKNMGKEVPQRYYVSSGTVRGTIRTLNASKSSLSGAVVSSGSPIALSKFKVSPNRGVKRTKKGFSPGVYSAGVEKSGGLKPLSGDPKAFIADMKSGHTGVWNRVSSKRLPIKQLYGPSVPQMAKNEEIMVKINKEAGETLEKRINAEINNILRKG